MFLPWWSPTSQTRSEMEDTLWYERPLDLEDAIAGGSLLCIGCISIGLYLGVLSIMKRHEKEIVGYRFLLSGGLADMLLLINYGVWPGLTILGKSEFIHKSWRHWLQLYLDWIWFSMVWHYSLVAWSRWLAIYKPHAFRNQSRRLSFALCSACYFVALIQVLCTHFQSWYVTFYYEPSSYGMLSEDFPRYLEGGQSAMFLSFHVAAIIPPIIFYTWTIVLLMKRRRSTIVAGTVHSMLNSSIESRLLVPCVINVIMFIFGQVVITYGTGEGKWAGWTVMFLFCTNSLVNPVLLLICSATIRRQLFEIIGIGRVTGTDKIQESTIFRNNTPLMDHDQFKLSSVAEIASDSTEPIVYV